MLGLLRQDQRASFALPYESEVCLHLEHCLFISKGQNWRSPEQNRRWLTKFMKWLPYEEQLCKSGLFIVGKKIIKQVNTQPNKQTKNNNKRDMVDICKIRNSLEMVQRVISLSSEKNLGAWHWLLVATRFWTTRKGWVFMHSLEKLWTTPLKSNFTEKVSTVAARYVVTAASAEHASAENTWSLREY